jgi:hypothetical protein
LIEHQLSLVSLDDKSTNHEWQQVPRHALIICLPV